MKWETVNSELPAGSTYLEDDDLCRCPEPQDLILEVTEGTAVVKHPGCGRQLWPEPEEINTEIPIKMTVETCGTPGGWHGMVRCDCGPDIHIVVDAARVGA